jgi:hypothetical protein
MLRRLSCTTLVRLQAVQIAEQQQVPIGRPLKGAVEHRRKVTQWSVYHPAFLRPLTCTGPFRGCLPQLSTAHNRTAHNSLTISLTACHCHCHCHCHCWASPPPSIADDVAVIRLTHTMPTQRHTGCAMPTSVATASSSHNTLPSSGLGIHKQRCETCHPATGCNSRHRES